MSEERIVIKIPATISKVMTMADKGIRLWVDTQEIHPDNAGQIMTLKDKLGYFVFAEQLKNEDVKDLPQIELDENEKAPSARLRAVLYVFWEKNKIQEPFDLYYRRAMEKFITSVKEKLN